MLEQVVYELTLYKPVSEDPAEAAVLTQLEDAGQQFIATTRITDTRPYLRIDDGRRGRFDPRTKHVDTGTIHCSILDKSLDGASVLDRWFTRFFGNAAGRIRTTNVRARIRESVNGGGFTNYFTGRVYNAAFDRSKLWVTFEIFDLREDLDVQIFTNAPHSSISYAKPAVLLPSNGMVTGHGYSDFATVPKLQGTVTAVTGLFNFSMRIAVDQKKLSGLANLYTAGLREAAGKPAVSVGLIGTRGWTDARVRVKILQSGAAPGRVGEEGDFYLADAEFATTLGTLPTIPLGPLQLKPDSTHGDRVIGLGILPVGFGDPFRIDPPAAGDVVEFYIYRAAAPTPAAPLYINRVKIATLIKNILEGKFGRLDSLGAVLQLFASDSAAFSALEADPAAATGQFIITKPMTAREFIEEQLCLPHELAYRVDADGEFLPFSTKLPSSVAGIQTIGTDDVIPGADSVGVDTGVPNAITRLLVKFYSDMAISDAQVKAQPDRYRDLPASRITSEQLEQEYLFDRYADIGDKSVEIDAQGVRFSPSLVTLDPLGFQSRPEWVNRYLDRLASTFRSAFSDGAMIVRLKCRRTAPVTSCWQGDLRIVSHPGIPNPATNRRGGNRLMRCLERSERGASIELLMLDLGPDTVSVAPAFGSVGQNAADPKHTLDVNLTLNAASESAEIWVCATDQSVGVRPADDDVRWVFAARVVATGLQHVARNPARRRIWLRARTQVDGLDAAKLPSAWVYPAGDGYIDTQALTAPSALATTVTGRSIALSCTPGETLYPLMPLIAASPGTPAPVRPDPLPPGSTRYVFEDLAAGTYNVGFRHVDTFGGDSAIAQVNDVATVAPVQLARPLQVQFRQASGAAVIDRLIAPRDQTGVGFEVRWHSSEAHADVRIQLARDLAFTQIDHDLVCPATLGRYFLASPLDGVQRFVRLLATRTGYVDSDWSAIIAAYPTVLRSGDGPDTFPGGWAYVSLDSSGAVRVHIGTDDPDTEEAFYEVAVVDGVSSAAYPEVDHTDTQVLRSAMPFHFPLPGTGLTPGTKVLLTVRFRGNDGTTWGQTVYDEDSLVEIVPALSANFSPTVEPRLVPDQATGSVTLRVTRSGGNRQWTAGFIYNHSTVGFQSNPSAGTRVFFDATGDGSFFKEIALPTLALNATVFVNVWAFGFGPGDSPITGGWELRFTRSVHAPVITADYSMVGYYEAGFRVGVVDPYTGGGVFEAWTQPPPGALPGSQPNFAGAPSLTINAATTAEVAHLDHLTDAALRVKRGEFEATQVKFKWTNDNTPSLGAEIIIFVPAIHGFTGPRGGLRDGLSFEPIASGGDAGGTSRGGGQSGPTGSGVTGTPPRLLGDVRITAEQGGVENLFFRGLRVDYGEWVLNAQAEIGYYAGIEGLPLTAGGEVQPNVPDTRWRLRLSVRDASGAELATYTSPDSFYLPPAPGGGWQAGQEPPTSGRLGIPQFVPPAGAAIAILTPEHVSGPTGGGDAGSCLIRHPSLSPGGAPRQPSQSPSLSLTLSAADQAAQHGLSLTAEQRAQSGAQVGVPLTAVSTQPVYDRAGLQVMIDTLLGQIRNSVLDRATTLIDDVQGVLREIEDIRTSAVKDAEAIGLLLSLFSEMMQRELSLVGVPGSSSSAQRIVSGDGLLEVYNATVRDFRNIVGISNTSGAPINIGVATVNDGLAPRSIVKGFKSGFAKGGKVVFTGIGTNGWQDGDDVLFDTLFSAPPSVEVDVYAAPDPRQCKWTAGFDPARPVVLENVPLNVTASGFRMRARYSQKPVTHGAGDNNFPAGTFDALNETSGEVTITDSALADRFTVTASGTFNTFGEAEFTGTINVTLAIEASLDGSTGWTVVDQVSRLFSAMDSDPHAWSESRVVAIPGLVPGTSKLRWKLTAFTSNNGGTFSGTGTDVQYTTETDGATVFTTDNYGAGVLDAEGESLSLELSAAPPWDDKYIVRFGVSMSALATKIGGEIFIVIPASVHMEVAIDSSSDGGSNWVERASYPFDLYTEDYITPAEQNYTFETPPLSITGLTSTAPADEIRVRLKVLLADGSSPTFGQIDPASVRYALITGAASFASMTPNQERSADDRARWRAQSV